MIFKPLSYGMAYIVDTSFSANILWCNDPLFLYSVLQAFDNLFVLKDSCYTCEMRQLLTLCKVFVQHSAECANDLVERP